MPSHISSSSDITSSRKPNLHLPSGLPSGQTLLPPGPGRPSSTCRPGCSEITVPLDSIVSGEAPFALGQALLCAGLCPTGPSREGRRSPGIRESASAWVSGTKVGIAHTVIHLSSEHLLCADTAGSKGQGWSLPRGAHCTPSNVEAQPQGENLGEAAGSRRGSDGGPAEPAGEEAGGTARQPAGTAQANAA